MHNSGTSKKKTRTDDGRNQRGKNSWGHGGPPNVLAAMPSVAAMPVGRPVAVTAPPPAQIVSSGFINQLRLWVMAWPGRKWITS